MVLTVLSVAYPFAPVGPDAVGGAEQVLSTLDRALVGSGNRSIVVAAANSATDGQLVPLPVVEGGIDDRIRHQMWVELRQVLEKVLASERIDVVHMHGIDFAEYLPVEAPTLATLHLPLDWYPASIFDPRPNLWLHCVSPAQHATRPRGARLLPPIANGISPRLLETRHRTRDFGLMLSRICPEKGVDIALKASRMAGMPLYIGGQVFPYEAHQRYFEDEVRPLLDERRRFLGPLGFERKRRLLSAARCVLIPSLVAETSSLTAIEALACGTPVIAFPSGALSDVVEHGRTGFLVRSAEEMADAIAHAGSIDPETCRQAVAERFSLSRMTRHYLELYRRIGRSAAEGGQRDGERIVDAPPHADLVRSASCQDPASRMAD